MQYISAGRFIQEPAGNKAQPYIIRPRTATPRRMSVCIMEQGRKSVLSKHNTSRDYLRNEKNSKGIKTPRDKTKVPLFIKGNNVINANKSREELKKKISHDKTHPAKRKTS